MTLRLFMLFLSIFVITCTSCQGETEPVATKPYIQKNKAEIDEMLGILNTFTIGSTKIEKVKLMLGSANSEVPNFGPKGKKMEKVGTILTYYVVKTDEDLVNSKKDEYVKLTFDLNGVLTNILKSQKLSDTLEANHK